MKKVMRMLLGGILTLAMVLSVNTSVFAAEVDNADIVPRYYENAVEVNSYQDVMERYGGQDGVYAERMSDEMTMYYEVKTEQTSMPLIRSVRATTQTKSHTIHSTLTNKANQIVWKSTLKATYKYNGTHVWCTNGITYFNSDLGSSRTLTRNSYSSAKTTGNSYYYVDSTIYTASYGTYYLHEFIYCTKTGYVGSDSRYNR